MRSEGVLNITGARALALLRGAQLWRAYLNARSEADTGRTHAAYRKWADAYGKRERWTEKQISDAMERIARQAYDAALWPTKD